MAGWHHGHNQHGGPGGSAPACLAPPGRQEFGAPSDGPGKELPASHLEGFFHMEKEMATHSSILAWRTPWTEEPGRLQSMGSQESDTI